MGKSKQSSKRTSDGKALPVPKPSIHVEGSQDMSEHINPEQSAEIAEQRAGTALTRRTTVSALEEILY